MADSNGGIELKSQALTEMLLNDNDETSATQPNAVPRRDRSFYIEPVTFLVLIYLTFSDPAIHSPVHNF